MVCLLRLGPCGPTAQCVSHRWSPRTSHAHIHVIRSPLNSGRSVRAASQQEQFQWHGVVPPLLAPQRAWASVRRGANCVADSHKGLGECTVALQNPGSEQPVAYVLGVPTGGQASENVSQQLTQLLQLLQCQQQQHNQHQQLLVLLDSAAAAHTTSGVAAAATDSQVQCSSDKELHQLQQLAELVAAYGGQLQVLPEQQQQAASGDTVPAAASAPAKFGDLGNRDDEDDLAVLMARLAAKQPPPEVLRAAAEEVEKLRQGGDMQPEAAEVRAHLELLAYLPWSNLAWQEQEQQAAVRSNTALPPEQQQQQGPILRDNDSFRRLIQERRGRHHTSDAEQNSSSSSSDMGALLLSGLGQAGRAAAGAATAAAGAVLNVIEGAAMATVAALAAYDQRGVDVAADLPDTSLRPSAAVDWRHSPQDGQMSWQAALTFCALLIQLENAGYDVVITGGDDDEGSNDASHAASHAGAADGDDSPQELMLRALIERGILQDIPDGSIVRFVANEDGDVVGIEVIVLPGIADVGGSGTTHLQNLLANGVTPEQLVQAWPELRGHPVLKGLLDGAKSDKNQQQQRRQQEGTEDGSTAAGAAAAAEEGDSSAQEDFTPLGMRISDDGKVFLLGVDRKGNIRVKDEPTKPGSSSSSNGGSKAQSNSTNNNNNNNNSSSSSGAAAGLRLDALLEAGQLPLSTSSSGTVSAGVDTSSNDSSSADAATTAADTEDSGPDSNSSSQSTVLGNSSSAAESDSKDQASSTNAAAADNSAEPTAAAEQLTEGDNEASGLVPGDGPKALSSSDAIHLLKKEFRRRVSSAPTSNDDDVTATAAADGSSGSDNDDVDGASAADVDASAADDDGDSRSDQQRGSGGSTIARSSLDLSVSAADDDDDDDQLAVRTDNPELLAAMLQLERSWHSTSSGGSSVLKQPQSDAGPPAAPPAAAAAGGGEPNTEPVPDLLPRPLRPLQPDQHSSDSIADASGSSSTADTDHSNSSSSKQSGLTEQEAAEVQAIISDTRAGAAADDNDLQYDAAAARLRSRRNKQRKQLQQQQGKQDNTSADATSSSSIKADQPVSSSSSSSDGSSSRSGQGGGSAQASIESDSDSDSDVDVTDLFQQFAAKLEAEGVLLDEDETIALFVDLYGEDSNQDSDADSGDDESEVDESEGDESAGDESSPTAASSSSSSSSKEAGSKGTSSKDNSSSSSNVRAAAAGDLIRSRRSQDSSSSGSSSRAPLPGGPGWDQLGRMVGGEALSKLRDLLRSSNVRLSGLNPPELGVLLTGLSRLQKGERLDSEEISLLLRFINEAEITSEGDEQHPDEKLKRRNKVLRRQQQQSRAGFNRSASSRASTLGFGVGIKDKAYVQDTRSLRVPKSAGNSRGEQVKQLLRQLRAERQQRELMLNYRQALQYARLHLSATLEVNLDRDAADSTRASSSSSSRSDGNSIGKDSGAPSDVQSAVADDPVGGGVDAAPGARNSSKAGSSSGWRAALKGLGSVFGKADAKFQRQQQQPAAQQQQEVQSSSTSISNSDQRMYSTEQGLREQQQQAWQARSTMLIQQLQHVLAEPASTGLGTTPAAADAAGASFKRVVVAVVPLDQLECVRQQWNKATGI